MVDTDIVSVLDGCLFNNKPYMESQIYLIDVAREFVNRMIIPPKAGFVLNQ